MLHGWRPAEGSSSVTSLHIVLASLTRSISAILFLFFFVSPAYLGEYTATLMQIGFFASPYFSVFSNVACTSQIEILNGARSIRVRHMHPTANCFIWQSEKMQDQFFRILPTQNTAMSVNLLVFHRRDISTFINNLMI